MNVCWNLTSKCNQFCVYCFRELTESDRTFEDNIAIIRKLKGMGVTRITYAGGEPLLYDGIKDLMAYSKYLGIENALITNGSILNKDNIDEFLENVDKLTFSVDSPIDYVNSQLARGENHYSHIKEILPYINERFPNIWLEINSVVTSMNYKEMQHMVDAIQHELKNYGIKKLKMSRFYPLRGYAKERKDLLSVTDEQFEMIKQDYDGKKAAKMFEISVRDLDAIDDNLVISPRGALKVANNGKEEVLVEDIAVTSTHTLRKVLGGRHV